MSDLFCLILKSMCYFRVGGSLLNRRWHQTIPTVALHHIKHGNIDLRFAHIGKTSYSPDKTVEIWSRRQLEGLPTGQTFQAPTQASQSDSLSCNALTMRKRTLVRASQNRLRDLGLLQHTDMDIQTGLVSCINENQEYYLRFQLSCLLAY